MKTLARYFTASLLLFALATTRAEDKASLVDVSGTWNLEVVTEQGTGTPSFTFTQDGESLTGLYKGLFGEAPVTGNIKGGAITFSIRVDVQGQEMTITYSGAVTGDSMKGTIKFGNMGDATFSGKKKVL